MDANGLRSFGLGFDTGLYAWRLPLDPAQPEGERSVTVETSPSHRVTAARLASRRGNLPLAETRTSVAEVALEPAMVIDASGSTLRWDREAAQLVSVSQLADMHAGLGPVPLVLPAEAQPVADLALGDDDALYVAGGGRLWLFDLRARYQPTPLAIDGFTPQRLAALPGGGVLALDVGRGRLARIGGLPGFTDGVDLDQGERFEACERNPHPLHASVLPAQIGAGEKAIAIACNAEGVALVLTLALAAGGARIRLLREDASLSAPLALGGPRFPHTLAWLDGERIALATRGSLVEPGRAPRDPGVFVYDFPRALGTRLLAAQGVAPRDPLQPLGDYYPLAGWTGGPFVNARPGARLHYPRADARTGAAPVARISAAARCTYGVLANFADDRLPGARIQNAPGLIDTADPATTWHRLHVEACVPAGAAMIVWLSASDTGPPRFVPGAAAHREGWHAHVVGERAALPAALASLRSDTPRAAWMREPSEAPFGESLLGCEREPDRSGVFSALIQRPGLAVRALRGARLWLVAELYGDGRASPELVALRATASRMSYRDRYLPALYHESAFGEETERASRATGPDFLERFIHLFEGPFTSIEDRIAAAWTVSDAHACPEDALPWLAGWIGLALEPGMPPERARWMIANGPRLAQRHGTLEGLQLALDIATDGGVTRGRIVVVENWRLRRTLATILGAVLTDTEDPLTAGISQSGNSFVGDSLFLGDESAKTFLALFRVLRSAPGTGSDEAQRQRDEREAAIHALYDGLAWRVTVLVHESASDDELRTVQRLAASGAPAHVGVRVATARYPFLVGVASLVGADTYLREPESPQPVRVNASRLGYLDTLQGLGSVDAHAGAFRGVLASRAPARPVARIRADRTEVGPADPFNLDGSESSAAPDRHIERYSWRHEPPA
jgi:phage tail-like protein